jgi:hypothetical protein
MIANGSVLAAFYVVALHLAGLSPVPAMEVAVGRHLALDRPDPRGIVCRVAFRLASRRARNTRHERDASRMPGATATWRRS